MKIILREEQLNNLIESRYDTTHNYKPSLDFDLKHGTKLSQKYFLPLAVKDDECWEIFSKCKLYRYLPPMPEHIREAYCDYWKNIVNSLSSNNFPYPNVDFLPKEIKEDILCGMASGLNFDDIVWYSIRGIKNYMNKKVKEEIKRIFPKNIDDDINWVISPETLEKMKDQISQRKLNLTNIAKEQ